jgi:hypothetical protein
LPAYVGDFYSPEADAVFAISVKDGQLQVKRESDPAAPLVRVGDGFRARGLTFQFQKDGSGRIDRFTVDAGRVRGIVFARTPAAAR